MTTFGDQVYQYGGVPLGGQGMLPVLGGGAKAFFVDPANGADGNTGLKPDDALDTVAAAYALCTDKQGDVVYLLNDGNTSGSARETAALVWAKDNTHLVGLCAPSINQRSRITPTSGSTDVDAYTPFLTVSGHGCIFQNISLVQGNSEDGKASVGILCSGNRNYFNNVSVLTGQHANQGDEASEWVRVTGEENVFEKCFIGTDTIARGNNNASASVRFGDGTGSQAARNVFRNCIFPMFADDTEPLFVRVSAVADVQRWNLFEGCSFINTGTSTLAAAVAVVGSVTGKLFFKDCAFYGMTDVTAADSSDVLLYGISGASVVDVGHYKGVDID
jgi:hypothetical protein